MPGWPIALAALGGAAVWLASSDDSSRLNSSSSPASAPPIPPTGEGIPLPTLRESHAFIPPASDSGRQFLLSLGQGDTDEREQAIVDAVRAGFFVPIQWQAVSWETKDHGIVTIFCATDALRIGLTDSIRVNTRHGTAQILADMLGAVLPTTAMADAAWLAAQQVGADLPPRTLPADEKMSSTDRMIEHSDLVGQSRLKRGMFDGQLGRDNGKDWVNTERLIASDGSHALSTGEGQNQPAAANFGWHMKGAGSASPGTLPVIQSVGLRHGWRHVDYSQVVTLYRSDCIVDNRERSVVEVLASAELSYVLSDEVIRGNPAKCLRYPGVPLGTV